MNKNSLFRGLCFSTAIFAMVITIALFFLDTKILDIDTIQKMLIGTIQMALCSSALGAILASKIANLEVKENE